MAAAPHHREVSIGREFWNISESDFMWAEHKTLTLSLIGPGNIPVQPQGHASNIHSKKSTSSLNQAFSLSKLRRSRSREQNTAFK